MIRDNVIFRNQLCTLFAVVAILAAPQFVISAQDEDSITVFAASSLTDAFEELSTVFNETSGVAVVLNFAGSSTLAVQIEQGAPADVFASANATQMQNLVEDKLVDENAIQIFAENQLVVIVPADNPAQIETLTDLANSDPLIVMASKGVPIRVYTDELLQRLTALYGDNYVTDVLANVVSEEPNVRQVVARVVLGEADAAIVYRTDITPDVAESLTIIELPTAIESPIARYPIAPLLDAPHPDSAAQFIEFVLSDEGQAILQKWGFCSPGSPEEMIEATPEVTPEITPEVEVEARPCA
jgi:molybdate transport system substrate-binding protein